MAKWIGTDKKKYSLGETVNIVGDVAGNLLNRYTYELVLGIDNEHEKTIATGIDYSAINKGEVSINLEADYAAFALPYSTGRLCYIKAIGSPSIGNNVVEYVNYLNIYADLLPSLSLLLEIDNGQHSDCMGQNIVKNYTSVTAKAVPEAGAYTSIDNIRFFGGVFNRTVTQNEENEYTSNLSPIKVSGELECWATLTVKAGSAINENSAGETEFEQTYTVTKSISFNAIEYNAPYATFPNGYQKPVRIDGSGNAVSGIGAVKNTKYALKFKTYIDIDSEVGIVPDPSMITRIKIYRGEIETDIIQDCNITADAYGITAEYNGKPVFIDGEIQEEGLKIYSAYPIVITVNDGVTTSSIVITTSTLFATMHMKAGGRGIKIGGYATEDDLFESEWDIQGNENITALKNLTGNIVKAKEGILFPNDETVYAGTGAAENKIAKGNHNHGNILNSGIIEIDKNTVDLSGAVLVDKSGKITALAAIPFSVLKMTTNKNNMQASASISNTEVTHGTEDSGMCFANHVHPYSEAWKQDEGYKELMDNVNELKDTISQYL